MVSRQNPKPLETSIAVAKPLILQLGERDQAFTLNKVDRTKLYGYKELEARAEEGVCDLATLADDGCTLIARGGTGLGQLSADGEWCDKKSLRPFDVEGKEITPVPSSLNAPIQLNQTVPPEVYLSHNIRLVYHLVTEDDHAPLSEQLKGGAIYSFPYSYRGGLVADAGFLLMGETGDLFLAVGAPTKLEFIGLQQVAATTIEDEVEEEDSDSMDFDMI
jgi:hypothetical protein